MIVNWKDDAGRIHTGDDQGKEYQRYRAEHPDDPAELAPGGAVEKATAASTSATEATGADPAPAKRTAK